MWDHVFAGASGCCTGEEGQTDRPTGPLHASLFFNAKITIISDSGSRFLVMLKDGVVPPQGMGKEAARADVLEV